MKLFIDPMWVFRDKAKNLVNDKFFRNMQANSALRAIHTRKKDQAERTLKGEVIESFVAEAQLRDMSPEDFAQLVLQKAAEDKGWDQLEVERQKASIRIDAAKDPEELDGILKDLGVGGLNVHQ